MTNPSNVCFRWFFGPSPAIASLGFLGLPARFFLINGRKNAERDLRMLKFMLSVLLLVVASPVFADAYSISWSSLTSGSVPVPIPSIFLVPAIVLLSLIAWRYKRFRLPMASGAVLIAALVTLDGVIPITSADGGRTYSISTTTGNTSLTCGGNTLVVEAAVPVTLGAVSADFDTATANTLVCGTGCQSGTALNTGESCSLKCPGGASIDSDGDGTPDVGDGFSCDESKVIKILVTTS